MTQSRLDLLKRPLRSLWVPVYRHDLAKFLRGQQTGSFVGVRFEVVEHYPPLFRAAFIFKEPVKKLFV
jgi:hypothetical protein